VTQILHGHNILSFLRKHAAQARDVRIAAPFWGGDAIVRLGLKPAKRYQRAQLICNLESGACNPQPIVSLKEKLNWTIKTNERLHAKVYLFDDVAIVGSANPSANGLALQDTEVNSWHEVCVVVSQRQQIKELRQWFEKIFKQSGGVEGGKIPLTF
jgi:phosphatidylserine/phosphatidylglycerophosphate/cardiolipin synthase-like enzyme